MSENKNYNPDVLSCLANLSNDEVFTPPNIVNNILDLLPLTLWSDPKTKFLDPVTKSGVFLREIVKRLDNGLSKIIPNKENRIKHILTQQVYGIAITELTSLLSRRTLYCAKDAKSKYSLTDDFLNNQGNIRFNKIEHIWDKNRCSFCGASSELYLRQNDLENHAYEFIHTFNPLEIFNMKFDVIIGNPPYQLNDGGNGASASPIYNKFVTQAKKLNPRFIAMIIPSRWFAGGKGLDQFREEMLSDKKIRYLVDYVNAKECFPNISLGGGVCYFLWDRDNEGPCEVINVLKGDRHSFIRDLNEYPIFVRYNKSISIIKKIINNNEKSVSDLVYSRNPFGISSSERGNIVKSVNDLTLISSKGIGFISSTAITQGKHLIGKYKVLLSKVTSEHAGEPDKSGQFKIISKIQVLSPNEVCTDSYLIVGTYDNKKEANNLCNYLKTKFARFLLLQAVSSINLSKDKFCFVPIQDLDNPVSDDFLNKKYNLTIDEIDFINSMVKPME